MAFHRQLVSTSPYNIHVDPPFGSITLLLERLKENQLESASTEISGPFHLLLAMIDLRTLCLSIVQQYRECLTSQVSCLVYDSLARS